METIRTICCKLDPTPAQAADIDATLVAFAKACECASDAAKLMDWLSRFGGKVYWSPAGRDGRTKPCAVWKVTHAVDCFRLLTAVLPYLIIKKHKATAAIAFLREKWEFA